MKKIDYIKNCFHNLSNSSIAEHSKRFFKTGDGEYGEGDLFLGIRVPDIRKIVKSNKDISLDEIIILISSKYHEIRLAAVLFLVQSFDLGDDKQKTDIYNLYLDFKKYINNWDLVDLSAHKIIGVYLKDKNRDILYELAVSKNLWQRRMSIIATFAFIKDSDLTDGLALSKILLNDKHDLIHKAVGWVFREIGKKDLKIQTSFLKNNYDNIPRTTLRYAIERFPELMRQKYLKKTF